MHEGGASWYASNIVRFSLHWFAVAAPVLSHFFGDDDDSDDDDSAEAETTPSSETPPPAPRVRRHVVATPSGQQ